MFKQEQFDDGPMNAFEEPANRPFLPSEEDIMPPQNQLANLRSGWPLACLDQKRARSLKTIHGRRQPTSRPYLEAWAEGHPRDQYPKKEIVSELAAKENLTVKQVKGWFGRRRKRQADAPTSSNSMPGSGITHLPKSYPCLDTRLQALPDSGIFHDLRGEDLTGLEDRGIASSLAEMLGPCPSTSPIEQYAMTPSREECSTIQTPISVQNDGGPPRFTKRPTSPSNIRYRAVNGPTVTPQVIDRGNGTALGPNISFSEDKTSSVHPSRDLSIPSGGKPTLPHRQKGKRVAPQKPYAPERQANKIYQCTQCNIGYEFVSDWARHLEIHEPQQQWTCMLQGETVVVRGKLACPFCNASKPTHDHLLIEHKVSQCADKKRTFQRRDHILSHMKRMHKSSVQNPPDAWMTVVHEDPNQQFWCGFCREFLRTTWDSRLEHLSHHFKVHGFDMTKWAREINPFNSAPSMNSPLPGAGSPMSHSAFIGPATALSMSPTPSTSPNCFNDFDHPLDPDYPTGSGPYIDPALLDRRLYPNDAPLPGPLAYLS